MISDFLKWKIGCGDLKSAQKKNEMFCGGDSGGPLFPLTENEEAICVYGVASYVYIECVRSGVSARVSAYQDWIETIIATYSGK